MEKSWPSKKVNTVGSTDGMDVYCFPWRKNTVKAGAKARARFGANGRTPSPFTMTVPFPLCFSYPRRRFHRGGERGNDGTIRG
ncbi:hypothetical protein [Candidatus Sodalis sp. SoCistrobi]|uniref:hypothetical protein n=1 Tax=Candidatus Sodalis sp. SoCistrobi TaxID=1922216 RepID=UPI0015775C56|nr:hypothetical protein [Candidatus Sodalis sp. SoCistrobi]